MLTTNEPNDTIDAEAAGSAPTTRRGWSAKASREWLGLRELTKYADISERTLRSWIYRPADALPAVKVCGKVLVRKSDFDAYLHRHLIKPFEAINLDRIVSEVLAKGGVNGR